MPCLCIISTLYWPPVQEREKEREALQPSRKKKKVLSSPTWRGLVYLYRGATVSFSPFLIRSLSPYFSFVLFGLTTAIWPCALRCGAGRQPANWVISYCLSFWVSGPAPIRLSRIPRRINKWWIYIYRIAGPSVCVRSWLGVSCDSRGVGWKQRQGLARVNKHQGSREQRSISNTLVQDLFFLFCFHFLLSFRHPIWRRRVCSSIDMCVAWKQRTPGSEEGTSHYWVSWYASRQSPEIDVNWVPMNDRLESFQHFLSFFLSFFFVFPLLTASHPISCRDAHLIGLCLPAANQQTKSIPAV